MSNPNPPGNPVGGDGPPGAPTAPSTPRSPRITATTTPNTLPQPMFIPAPHHQPRPNIGSMLFLTAFFFFMSGNNQVPPSSVVFGPDGELIPRVTELDLTERVYGEYHGFLNGTGNWTEPESPPLLPSTLLPQHYISSPSLPHFTNITGFYRDARLHPISLLSSASSSSSPTIPHFFNGVTIPNLNSTSWNETHASELRGEFPWSNLVKWDMNLKERPTEFNTSLLTSHHSHNHASQHSREHDSPEWNWVKGVATLGAADETSIDYAFWGLHFVPNGTYGLFGVPDGVRADIRNIPLLWPGNKDSEIGNLTRSMILAELEKEYRAQQDSMLLSDVRPDEDTDTKCPLLIHLTIPPLPAGTTPEEIELYESELRNPTGIRYSLPRPPSYWQGRGLGGVIIADQCGWAFGLEGGSGVKIDDFWQRSINYAAFAGASQLLVLFLLVRQMESTRTPSTLTKVSLWTIVIMGISDSWIFSAHVVVGIMSDNRTSLPMLVPGFLCLCSAIVFGPRYAVLLHRIQAPERVSAPITPAPAVTAMPDVMTTTTTGDAPTVAAGNDDEDNEPLYTRIRDAFSRHSGLRWIAGLLFVFFILQVAFIPPIIPFFLFGMYSYWLPQIWRNARRGSSHSLDHAFVIGTAIGRLALPLYAFGYEDNVFFIKTSSWVWGLVVWQWAQIVVLFAQDRFGPAFFLPKSLQPAESYNYHPLLPPSDPENPASETEKTCSICMEEVDTRAGPSGEVLLGMNPRRAYALAPCGHLFHTKCLSQWLAIKNICPLCKRSLPSL